MMQTIVPIAGANAMEADEIQSVRARPMDSDEVLMVLRDIWRQQNCVDPDDQTEVPLEPDTNVERAANMVGLQKLRDDWQDIASFLKDWFRVDIGWDEWKRVLDPKREATLGPVCDLISRFALAPAIERTFGDVKLSWPAAAFRAVLLILRDAGVEISGVRPDSKLFPILRSYPHVFTNQISRLVPGRMPALRSANHLLRTGIGVVACVAVYMLLLLCIPRLPRPPRWVGMGMLPMLYAGSLMVGRTSRFADRRLGELTTFYDLCYALTSPPPAFLPPLQLETGEWVMWDAAYHPNVSYDLPSSGIST